MKKRILFLCAQRSIRSQMAESILTFSGHEQLVVYRRVRDSLYSRITTELLLESLRKVVPLRK